MKKQNITIDLKLFDKIISVLDDHHFSDDGEWNNRDVIDLQEELESIRKALKKKKK